MKRSAWGKAQQPFLYHGCPVRGQVVTDDVDGQAGLALTVNLIQEVAEVHRPALSGQLADHLASRGVRCGEQVDGAAPDVIAVGPPVPLGARCQGLARMDSPPCRASTAAAQLLREYSWMR